MRKAFIAANWKMNKTVPEAMDFIYSFLPAVTEIKDADIILAPPFTALFAVAKRLTGTNVGLSAQTLFYEEKGAFTGEVSAPMLVDVGCDYVIIGHSERRQFFYETDEVVNKKTKTAVKNGLSVIFCIGESLKEREAGMTFDVLKRQLVNGLEAVDVKKLVVAYEPVWAIGSGRTATPEQAQEAHQFIRSTLRRLYQDGADSVRILYGGSVTPDNIDSLMACADVDGALVGGAGLKTDSFERIVKFKRGNT